MASVTHSNWSLRRITENSSRSGVDSVVAATCSRVMSSVSDWKASMITTSARATTNHAFCVDPSASDSMPVTGTRPTATENRPTLAQIRATTAIFSRSFWSWVSEGSIDQ